MDIPTNLNNSNMNNNTNNNHRKYYTPQEIAEILGISKQTLLRYEKKNLFPKPKRNPLNNWRVYTEEDLKNMLQIIEGK